MNHTIRTFITFLTLLPVFAVAEPELKGSASELTTYLLDDRKVMVINGNAEEKADADSARVTLVVKTKKDSLQVALNNNKKIRLKIKQTLTSKGLADTNIKFTKFASTPGYGWFGDKPSSYEISNEIKILIKTEAELATIAGIVDSYKEVYFNKIEVEHSGKQQAQAKTIEKSLDDILSKKAKYEKKFGLKLQALRVVEDTVFEEMPTQEVDLKSRAKYLSSIADVTPAYRSGFGEIIYKAISRVEYIVVNN